MGDHAACGRGREVTEQGASKARILLEVLLFDGMKLLSLDIINIHVKIEDIYCSKFRSNSEIKPSRSVKFLLHKLDGSRFYT